MTPTTLLLFTAGIIIGSSVGYAFLSSRAFDRKHPEIAPPKDPKPAH